jgi:penicillin-binding protein 1B
VTNGTAAQLVRDGLGRLNSAGKTGTSNDGRDSWYAGWTGDHLAVVWVGNDQNKETGLYGATGAMRVWSSIFARLPSAPLETTDEGIDWQWVINTHSTDADCGGARRFAFVKGFAPPYAPCPVAEPTPEEGEGRSWRDWFGFGDDDDDREREAEREPAPAPPPEPH